eukprot:jgi/Botrbrau1/17657/Bobra.0166s0085.1
MKLLLLCCILRTVCGYSIDLQRTKTPKEAPNYRIIGGTPDYEIRKYDAATWATVEIGKVNFDGAVYVGAKPLLKYFDGENEEGIKLNYTTPMSVTFVPTVGKDGSFDGTLKYFNISFLIPSAYAEDPPTPLLAPAGSNNIVIEKVPVWYSYVTKFAGYAFERAVLKHADDLLAALNADGVVLDEGEGTWLFSKYDGGFLDVRNEVGWATETEPAKEMWTSLPYQEDKASPVTSTS